jgi:Ca2+-binding EF-hand superfamily protein
MMVQSFSRQSILATAIGILLVPAGLAHVLAQVPASPTAPRPPQVAAAKPAPGTEFLISQIRPGMTLERYLEALRVAFRQADADGDGLVRATDIELHGAVAEASGLAAVTTMIMRADLDGDGMVTEDELRRMLRYERRNWQSKRSAIDPVEQEVRRLMAADKDRNGRITWQEAFEFAKTSEEGTQMKRFMDRAMADSVNRILAVDSTSSGGVSLAQVEAAAEALLRTIDADGDGTVSAAELNAYRARPTRPSKAAVDGAGSRTGGAKD